MIDCERVAKYYGRHAALEGLDLSVGQGEVVGLLGLNGAGKTTILRILSGVCVPSAGRVRIAGLNMAEHPEAVRARLGFLPERPPLYGDMTVRAFLRFVARIKGYRGALEAAVDAALQATDLVEVQGERIDILSSGFARRVGIAQAVVHRPDLILLDEPTSGLDPVQIVHMRQLIRGLRGRHTLVVSSHLLTEIHQLCDRILVLHEGRVAASGSEADLAAQVRPTFTVALEVRGDSATLQAALAKLLNIKRVHVEREADGCLEATVELLADRREELAQAIFSAGMGLRSMTRRRVELESIFLSLTGDKPPD